MIANSLDNFLYNIYKRKMCIHFYPAIELIFKIRYDFPKIKKLIHNNGSILFTIATLAIPYDFLSFHTHTHTHVRIYFSV